MKTFLLFGLFLVSSLSGYAKINNEPALGNLKTSSEVATTLACTTCTKLIDSQCGATLASVSTSILAKPVASATNYRFEITKGIAVTVIETGTNRSFTLTQSPGLASYNTTYSIRAAAKIAGVWEEYGDVCTVSTPVTPGTSKVVSGQCGITLATVATSIFVDEIFLATTYRFEVSNGVNVIGTVDSPNRFFQLSQIAGVAYNTTYGVRVAVIYNGELQPYGTSCNITTPISITETKIVTAQCGVTIPTATTQISANEIFQATAYHFEVTNGITVKVVVNPNRFFTLSQLPGGASYGTTYSIRVAVVFGGVLQLYGPACSITLPPLTKLIASQCNSSLPSVTSPIWASQMPLAGGYRFQVTKGVAVSVYESTNRFFQLTLLPAGVASYNTTYSIKAAYKYNGVWLPYGDACSVTTPATVTTTKLIDSQCNASIPSISTSILVDEVFLASAYRFEVTQGVNVNTIETITRSFQLSQIQGIIYGTPCSIKAAVKFSDVWQDYGTACTVTLPSTVTATKLIDSQCGATLATVNTSILVNEVYLASDYRFEVTKGLSVIGTIENPYRYFSLSQLLGGGEFNTTYSIRVAVKFNDVWQDYGTSCTVKTPVNSTPRMSNADLSNTLFAVKAFPNPFSSHFNLDIESSSDNLAEVQVFDMLGRKLETHKGTVSELSTQELGSNYPAGVYNVIVSQGEQVKSLRMIKR